MKGLIIKDFYMTKRYCRSYLFMAIAFLIVGIFNQNSMFYTFYPCLLAGMIPANLISFEEKSKWDVYSMALPYSSKTIVKEKFIYAIIMIMISSAVVSISQLIKMIMNNTFELILLGQVFIMSLIATLIPTSTPLPFIFKKGAEQGRIVYYVMIGFFCVLTSFISNLYNINLYNVDGFNYNLIIILLLVISIAVFYISYILSIKAYKKRLH